MASATPQHVSLKPNVNRPAAPTAIGAAAVTTGATNSSPYGFVGATQADRLSVLVNEIRTTVNAILVALAAVGITA